MANYELKERECWLIKDIPIQKYCSSFPMIEIPNFYEKKKNKPFSYANGNKIDFIANVQIQLMGIIVSAY